MRLHRSSCSCRTLRARVRGTLGFSAGGTCRTTALKRSSRSAAAIGGSSLMHAHGHLASRCSPLVDALPELMTPASAALGVPCLVEPGEGAEGGEQINNQRCFWASPREPYSSELGGIPGNSARHSGLTRHEKRRHFAAAGVCMRCKSATHARRRFCLGRLCRAIGTVKAGEDPRDPR